MIKKANIQWTGKTLCNQIAKKNVSFDSVIQRKPVWDLDRKSLLIHTMIESYPIPPFYFARGKDGRYDCLDGQQRSLAITNFINDVYVLSEKTPSVKDENGDIIEISGKKFSELDSWIQDAIRDYSLTIYYFEDITDDEISEIFYRLNNGKPLSSIELTRVKAKSLTKFQSIAAHEMIATSVSETGKNRYMDENIAMQSWVLCFSDVKDLTTRSFRPCIENADVTDEQINDLNNALDYIKETCDSLSEDNRAEKRILRKLKTRTHLVSSIYLADKAIKNGMTQEEFGKILCNFFGGPKTSIDDDYNISVGSGSAKPENVKIRLEALDKQLDN